MEAELIQGSGGIFEVAVGANVVAAKTAAGFPTPEEIVQQVARALPSS